MIKGRYVAQVTIDYEVKEDMPGLLPFEKLKDVVQNQTTDAIKAEGLTAAQIKRRDKT